MPTRSLPALVFVLSVVAIPADAQELVAADAAPVASVVAPLVLSTETIRSHIKELYDRFGLEDVAPSAKRAELAAQAVRLGVVSRADL